jgi:hypothetical protein
MSFGGLSPRAISLFAASVAGLVLFSAWAHRTRSRRQNKGKDGGKEGKGFNLPQPFQRFRKAKSDDGLSHIAKATDAVSASDWMNHLFFVGRGTIADSRQADYSGKGLLQIPAEAFRNAVSQMDSLR